MKILKEGRRQKGRRGDFVRFRHLPSSLLPFFPSRKGFTLVEMLISLAIFAVITGMVMANFRLGAQGDELRISSQLVAASIRRAQTLAVAGQTVSYCQGGSNDKKLCPAGATDCPAPGSCVTETPAGYGVHFGTATGDNRRIILFADIDGDHAFDAVEEVRRENVSSGAFVIVESLTPNVGNALDIVFVPPKPTIFLNDGATADGTAVIIVKHSTTGQQKRVMVNKISGQISAE